MIDQKDFLQRYKQHLTWLSIKSARKSHISKVFEIFSAVIKNGGWARTIGLNNWESVTNLTDGREFYEANHLVSYERKMNNNWPYSAETNLPADQWEETLCEDVFLFRSVFNLGLSRSVISLEEIRENHGEEEISVIIQESDTSGFSVKKASKQKMRLKNYIDLMKGTIRDDKFIRFAVNVDIGNWSAEIDELRKTLPSEVLWCSKDDSLKYLRQHILGMTLPQLYLKINGCWTGGHEENLRFSAANINHGPSACEWWALDSSQSLQLRESIRTEKNFDIYNSETLWWPDEIYCLIQGFTVYHVIQQPGDLVLVGPGTIHWVKSCGVTTNTAWNFGPKTLKNFVLSFERDFINQAIKFKSLVPMNLLSLDLLNNEMSTLDLNLAEYLRDAILLKDQNEREMLEESGLGKVEKNNSDNVIHCEICYLETFRIYYKCSKCVENRYSGGNKFCFFCFNCMKNHTKTCKGSIIPVQKFTKSDLKRLVTNLELRSEGKAFEWNFEVLKYPYDKNTEEGIYVSPYDGLATSKDPELKIIETQDDRDKPLNVSVFHPVPKVEVTPRVKRRYLRKSHDEKKLSSLKAKKKMSEFDEASDLSEFLGGFAGGLKPVQALENPGCPQDFTQHKEMIENNSEGRGNQLKPLKNLEKNEKTGNSKSTQLEKLENPKTSQKSKKNDNLLEQAKQKISTIPQNPPKMNQKLENQTKIHQNLEDSQKNQGKLEKSLKTQEKMENQEKSESFTKSQQNPGKRKISECVKSETCRKNRKDEEKKPSRLRIKKLKDEKILHFLKIEENLMSCCEKSDSLTSDIPAKRFRSRDVYSPVVGLIPVKMAKVSLA